MVKSPGFRGVFAVLPTPFTPGGSVDFESLRRCVRFCIDAGAHGLVASVNASEFTLLTSAEHVPSAGGREPDARAREGFLRAVREGLRHRE